MYILIFSFFQNFSGELFYHLLRVTSQDKECFQIFNILFIVNFTINLTQVHVREFIHTFNLIIYFTVIQAKPYICHVHWINIAQINLQ